MTPRLTVHFSVDLTGQTTLSPEDWRRMEQHALSTLNEALRGGAIKGDAAWDSAVPDYALHEAVGAAWTTGPTAVTEVLRHTDWDTLSVQQAALTRTIAEKNAAVTDERQRHNPVARDLQGVMDWLTSLFHAAQADHFPVSGHVRPAAYKPWRAYLADPEDASDFHFPGHVLDRINWPDLYEHKLAAQRLIAGTGQDGDEARAEGLMCFLDHLQDYAERTLRIPEHLVFLHVNTDHDNHLDRPDGPDGASDTDLHPQGGGAPA